MDLIGNLSKEASELLGLAWQKGKAHCLYVRLA